MELINLYLISYSEKERPTSTSTMTYQVKNKINNYIAIDFRGPPQNYTLNSRNNLFLHNGNKIRSLYRNILYL